MSEAYLHVDLSTLKLAPGYLDDAYNHLNSATTALAEFNTALSGTGIKSRSGFSSAFNSSYSYITGNIYSTAGDVTTIEYNVSTIVDLVEQNENGVYQEGISVVDTSGLSDEEIAAATGSEVGEAKEDESILESVWGWICGIGSAIGEFIEGLVATFVDLVSSLLQGIVKLLEGIVDALILLGGTLVSWGASAINFIFGTEIDVEGIKSWVQNAVAYDFTGSVFQAFYENTGFGQWIANESWIYGTVVKDVIVGASTWAGIIVAGAAIAYFTAGTGLPAYLSALGSTAGATAVVAGSYGLGSGAEAAYANGASYYGGLGAGALKGTIYAFTGYAMGNAASALMAQRATLVTNNGTVFGLQRVGSGLGTRWQWVALSDDAAAAAMNTATTVGTTSTSLAVIPQTSTALSTYLAPTALTTTAGQAAITLPTILASGSFGLGVPLLAAGALGTVEALTSGGVIGGLGFEQKDDPNPTPGMTEPDVPNDDDDNSGDDDDDKDKEQLGVSEENPPIGPDPEDFEGESGSVYPSGGGDASGGGTGDVPSDPGTTAPESEMPTPEGETPEDTTPPAEEEPPAEDEPGEDEPPAEEEPPAEDEPGEDEPTDEPSDEEPGDEEPSDDEPVTPPAEEPLRDPNVEFINVGPEWITPTMTNTATDAGVVTPSGGSVGGATNVGTTVPEYTVPTETPAPEFTFESMTPTVENPALDSGLLDTVPSASVEVNGVNNVTTTGPVDVPVTPMDTTIESIEITPASDILDTTPQTTSSGFGVNTMVGLGGIATGGALAGAYVSSNKKEKEENLRNAASNLQPNNENNNEGFNQL